MNRSVSIPTAPVGQQGPPAGCLSVRAPRLHSTLGASSAKRASTAASQDEQSQSARRVQENASR